MIPEEIKDQIQRESEITRVIGEFLDLKTKGSKTVADCPSCLKKDSLQISKPKQIYKCFSCGYKGGSSVQFVMDYKKVSFPEALKIVAGFYGIAVDEVQKPRGPQRKGKPTVVTFRDMQMKQSGITDADQKVNRVDDDKIRVVDIFESGTRDQYGKLTTGDDMIIWYYDLDGKPVMYQIPKGNKMTELFRIRWQNPAMHCDKSGRPMKYSSPYGSGSHLFIPEQVREAYRERRVIKRLFIQEGEKKTVKACIHGIFSVGIMGIMNIAMNDQLPYEFELLIKACQIEEIIFLLDSDIFHLSNDLKPGDQVDRRPLNFFYAVRNFREHFKKFTNMGLYLETYFAYVKENENNDKGLDDLLTNTLAGRERELLDDINTTINEKSGKGKYLQINKISTVSDLKLREYWDLQTPETFAMRHKDDLLQLPEFKIGKHKWRFNDDGKFVPAQPLQDDEEYYEKVTKQTRNGDEYIEFKFRYRRCYNFLLQRGFGRYELKGIGKFIFIKQDNKIVEEVDSYHIRDYVTEFTEQIAEKAHLDDIMDMFYRGAKMYLGPDSLSNLKYINPKFETSDKNFQLLFFKNKYWKITADNIEEHPLSDLQYSVWKDKINDFDAKLLSDDFIKITRFEQKDIDAIPQNTGIDTAAMLHQFDIALSREASDCHFLSFLYNTCEFAWRKLIDPNGWRFYTDVELARHEDKYTLTDKLETNLHFVSKLTAIGYLLHKYRDKSCEKAVVAMDGRISEVGDSNGRSGKSILGFAIGQVIPQCYIGAKSKDLTDDPFIWEEVSEKTDNIFLDDVRANVDFEFFFPVITGKITINTKGTKKYTLSEAETPKIFITTNHAINGDSGSFRDRKFELAFSDYYNDSHKPIEDFGLNFFTEWDEKQWNYFYNLKARCLQMYFYAQKMGWGVNGTGLVQGPLERLELRRLRQFIGEAFLTWADEYFGSGDEIDSEDISNSNMNRRIARNELFNDFIDKNKNEHKFVNAHKFKKKIISYCHFRKLNFNPHKGLKEGKPIDDKSGGIEYFTVANSKYTTL